MHLSAHYFRRLKVAVLVDRGFASRHARLQDQHGLIRPRAGLQKCFVGLWIYEHVVKHGVIHVHVRAVAHIHARRQVHPLPVLRWELQVSVWRIHG